MPAAKTRVTLMWEADIPTASDPRATPQPRALSKSGSAGEEARPLLFYKPHHAKCPSLLLTSPAPNTSCLTSHSLYYTLLASAWYVSEQCSLPCGHKFSDLQLNLDQQLTSLAVRRTGDALEGCCVNGISYVPMFVNLVLRE